MEHISSVFRHFYFLFQRNFVQVPFIVVIINSYTCCSSLILIEMGSTEASNAVFPYATCESVSARKRNDLVAQ